MQLLTVRIDKPEATNFILGRTHFVKTVEDIHEALVGAVPGNATEVILAGTQQGRGIMGVVDGFSSKGVEDEAEIARRKNLQRQIGYKL